MAQDEYGAAQPIIDLARKFYDTANKYLGDSGDNSWSDKDADTSWHDDMVKKANKSFADEAAKDMKKKMVGSGEKKPSLVKSRVRTKHVPQKTSTKR